MQIIQLLLGLLGAAHLTTAVPTITVDNNYFINNDSGDRFQIVGIAYQPGGSSGYNPATGVDPLSNKSNCLRDAALMQILGVNAISVYSVIPDVNHDECVSIFNEAGIYMFIDVNSPLQGDSIDSTNPANTYTTSYLNRTFAVIEAFKDYPNTAAFIAGNEVISTAPQGSTNPPYIRAVIRDLKSYIGKHSKRAIPVGYAAADVRDVLFDTLAYLQCSLTVDSADDSSRADFFALNSYSWCGNSSFTGSTYDMLVAGFRNSSIPVLFSEYGCNEIRPRIFTEVPALYGDQMDSLFSGGIIYEFTQGENSYGVVNISSDGSAQLTGEFYTLKDQFASLNFTNIQGTKSTASLLFVPACNSSVIANPIPNSPDFMTDWNLPVLPAGAQDIIDNGVNPAPTGTIVTISDYTVLQTILDSNGNTLPGLEVVPLTGDQINQPGSNTLSAGVSSTTSTTSTSSASGTPTNTTASPSSTASEKSAAVGARFAQGESMPFVWASVAVVVASFIAGLLG